MTTLDLGNLTAGIVIDASNAEAVLDSIKLDFEAVAKSAEKVSKSTINVAPKGTRELSAAQSSVAGTAKVAELFNKNGLNVAPKGTRELDTASGSARGLSLALEGAGSAAKSISVNPQATTQLDKSSSSAQKLSDNLNQAQSQANQLGSAGGSLSVFEGGISRLTEKAKGLVPVLAAASGAGAIFSKGWDRLTGIDNAQFKLQGLGHTAESVGSIMDSAMDSVSGTAYGFGDAASLAAGAVAATGAQGDRLTEILTTITDTAAISGRSLSDIGLIFNQVAAGGVIMGDDLNQLLDSGIPIITYLADELGVASSEVKKLASEGQISFEVMESALRNNLGGAAQEMGASVSGALSNTGAAFGRLGAAVLSGPFSSLPSVLEGAQTGVNALTDGVNALYGAWGAIPAPLKGAAGALLAAKAVSEGLNTELGQKMVGSIKGVKDNVVGMGSSVKDAFGLMKNAYTQAAAPMNKVAEGHKTMAAAASVAALENKSAFGAADDMVQQMGHNFAATGAKMQATAKGSMGAAFAGLKMGASGLMTVMGGPWGLALAGAGAAAMLFTSQIQKTKQAQEEVKQATSDWADVLTESDGRITESVTNHALMQVEQAGLQKQLEKTGVSATDMAAAIVDLDGSYDGLLDQLDKMIEQGNNDPTAFRGRWYTDTAKAAMELKAELQDAHGVMEDGAAQAEETANAQGELADRIESSSAAARDSDGEFSNLHQVLDLVASEAKNADDAIEMLALELMALDSDPAVALQANLAEAVKSVQGFGDLLEKGKGGFNVEDGMFNIMDEQGQALAVTMQGLRQDMYETATAQYQASKDMGASGVEAAAEAAERAQWITDILTEQATAAGWTQEEINKLIETYGLSPTDVMTTIHTEGAERAEELMKSINMEMANIDDGNATLIVDADSLTLTEERAKELGYTWTDLGSNMIELKANNEQAIAALQEVADTTTDLGTKDNLITLRPDMDTFARAMNDVEGQVANFITNPKEMPLVVDTEEARRALDTYSQEYVEIGGFLYIEDETTPALMSALENLGVEIASLPEGNLIIESPTDEILEMLDLIGFNVMNLPDGQVLVDHENITAAVDQMKELGILVEGGAKGALTIDSNILENDKNFEQMKSKVEAGVKGDAKITDNSAEVSSNIDRRLQGKRTDGVHWITYYENPDNKSYGQRYGGRYHGGPIPALAYGGQAGYRLPLSGPGTGTVDGILGVDRKSGEPTAWVNRGEFVVNDKMTRRYLRTIEALNAGQPEAALRALALEIPKLESGGQVSRRVKNALSGMNGTPYIFGGWSSAGVDCTGATSLAANVALGLPMWESRHATMNMASWLSAKGALPGKGDADDMQFGFYNGGPGGGHAAVRLPDGTFVESGGNTGGGLTIGGKAGPMEGRGFTDWWHLPYSMDGEDTDELLTGDGGTTAGGMGTVSALKRTKSGNSVRASAPTGGAYDVPGFASNTPGASIGASLGGQASAEIMGATGGGAAGILNSPNPFVGNRTWADSLGPQVTAQMQGLATQHGFGAEVTAALNSFTPNWDVWLRVNDETIEAFNTLQEAKDNRIETAEGITEAELDLAEARETLKRLTEESSETSVANARKLEDAEQALNKARAGGKAETIANAEKKLARVKEDIANAATKDEAKRAEQLATATKNVEVAELNLIDAHSAAEQAAKDAEAAQNAYNAAMAMAPFYAVIDLFQGMADNMLTVADSIGRLNSVMEKAQEVSKRYADAELAGVQSKIDLLNAQQAVDDAERNASNQRHADMLAEQQAEWDLAMAKHEANQVVGASEVDLAAIREQGIYDVMQASTEQERQAILSASNVGYAEALLANVRAQSMLNEYDNARALDLANAQLEYSQIMAEAQADRLRVATQELAETQGLAAGGAMSAIAKETEGKAKKDQGILGTILGVGKVVAGVALAPMTGGASLALTASGIADVGSGISNALSGKAQEDAYREEARKEYDQLDDDTRRKVDLARNGTTVAALGGAVVGAMGGTSDDVNNVVKGINDLTSAPLNAEITSREAQLDAAAIRRDKALADIKARETQAELDFKQFQLDQMEDGKEERDALQQLVDLTGQQLAEHQQENQQLGQLNNTMSAKDTSVLMALGGSQWGAGDANAVIGMEPVGGFGGLSSTSADEWSTINVENGWWNTDRSRPVQSWTQGEEEYLQSLKGGKVEGLPDTPVVPGTKQSTAVPTYAEVQASAQERYELALAIAQAQRESQATTHVDTQFTGPVTVQGRNADNTINDLERSLARG